MGGAILRVVLLGMLMAGECQAGGWLDSFDPPASSWKLSTSFGYQLGVTELGAAYGSPGSMAHGPNLGFQVMLAQNGMLFGAEVQLPFLQGLGSAAFLPSVGVRLGAELSTKFTVWAGVGSEWLLIRTDSTTSRAQGIPVRLGIDWAQRSGSSFGVELGYRSYSLDRPDSTLSVSHTSVQVKYTLPIGGGPEERPLRARRRAEKTLADRSYSNFY